MDLFRKMAALTLIAALTGCSGGGEEAEDCTNGQDDDGDEAVDCDDAECGTNAACVVEDTDETDTEDTDPVQTEPEGPDNCRDGDDNDADGDADCEDAECASLPVCYFYAWSERGDAQVEPGTSYEGTANWVYTLYTPDPAATAFCDYEFAAKSVRAMTDCDGCEFAFEVELTDGKQVQGDCSKVELTDGLGGTDFRYGYGFDADYDYSGTTVSLFMYNVPDYGWVPMVEATLTESNRFQYDLVWGYYYYQ